MRKTLFLAIATLALFSITVTMAGSVPSSDYSTAERLFTSGQYREALPFYQRSLSALPASHTPGDVYSRIGDAYFRLADYGNALEAYRRAIKDQRPADRPQTQYWIGFCCFLVGRDTDAVEELLKVPALYPDARAWGSTSYYWAGRASERMGKKEQAAEYYRKAGGSGKSTQGKFAQKKAEAVKNSSTK